jgi:hypothetical protein
MERRRVKMDKDELELLETFNEEQLEEYFGQLRSLTEEYPPGRTVWEERTGREFRVLTAVVEILMDNDFKEYVYLVDDSGSTCMPVDELTTKAPASLPDGAYLFCPLDEDVRYNIWILRRFQGDFFRPQFSSTSEIIGQVQCYPPPEMMSGTLLHYREPGGWKVVKRYKRETG